MFGRGMQVIALTALVASAASAQVRQLTFEGLQNNEAIGNFYNGGTGGNGSGPGPAWGITFTASALAICPGNLPGCSGNFGNNPSAPNAMFWLQANPIMNVAPGFTTGFSTFYTNVNDPGAVEIWSGLNATGSLLGTVNLPALGDGSGDPCTNPGANFCRWAGVGTTFAGTAFSVRFTGAANFIAFDNVTFGSDRPQTIIPEPSTYALLATGMAGLAFARRRRRQG
jgi:hypothetical protein